MKENIKFIVEFLIGTVIWIVGVLLLYKYDNLVVYCILYGGGLFLSFYSLVKLAEITNRGKK